MSHNDTTTTATPATPDRNSQQDDSWKGLVAHRMFNDMIAAFYVKGYLFAR